MRLCDGEALGDPLVQAGRLLLALTLLFRLALGEAGLLARERGAGEAARAKSRRPCRLSDALAACSRMANE